MTLPTNPQNEPQPVTQPVQEPTIEPKVDEPVKTEPVKTEPVKTEPTPKANDEVDIIKLLATADKSVLLKSEIVQSLLENARTQEKDKLYKTVEGKENTIKQLNDTISDLQNQLKSKEELSMEGEKELLEQLQQMKEAQDKLIEDMEKEKENTRLAKLEAFKTQAINEANGELIVDLVGGSTEEEITASIEKAKARYQEIVSPYKTKAEELEVQASKPNKDNAPKPANPTSSSNVEFTAEDIRGMSTAEYAKYREKLLGLAKA
jgi:hypothetical protein